MKYGHEDKKTGVKLNRDVYAEHFADPGDIKTNYTVSIHGDVVLEGEDSKRIAECLYSLINRLHMVRNHLLRIGRKKASPDEPSGDIE